MKHILYNIFAVLTYINTNLGALKRLTVTYQKKKRDSQLSVQTLEVK